MEVNFKTYMTTLIICLIIGGGVCFYILSEAEMYNSPQAQMIRHCKNQTHDAEAYVRVDGNRTRCCHVIPSNININEVKCDLLDWSK